MLRAILASVALLGAGLPTLACTAVDMVAADKTVIAGRTMEWAFDMKWELVSLPKGSKLTLAAPKSSGLPAKEIETLYPVVGVGVGILPGAPLLEGQNSAGLGMSANFLPGFTTYQSVTPQDNSYVEILSFGDWALGRFANVKDLRAALQETKVWSDPTAETGPTPPLLHFVFTDRSGAGIIVEYVGGKVQIHDNVAHVLTNAPTYPWHLLNVRNYLSLSTVGVSSRQIGSVDVTAIGQGGGLVGLPGDYTPPSRFVRATFLRHGIAQPKTGDEATEAVAHVLNTVDIPIGVAQSREKDGSLISDYTQWVAIKDLTHNRLTFADYNHRLHYLTIDLNQIFAQTKPMSKLVGDLPYPKAVSGVEALAP
ncbi:choloylglycine hydrolase family protein [Rhodoblastus acidophilus]|uniref:Choloylglycine hydrolase family protein n=1 Tax=Candidatus Rhodoblastus alkanivorans TaxID=2954117 RepID=A0ABS9Z6T6_9HYPH|nr:choloylglycine hydrolase family protein [Candidatus Rhodoblastus alkanivorans]MCI4680307.1 choloylglycine hydrolase family protein [Candidatus Rhodoblastus alkanivorans]MCI4682786.1 choloylglycine hydrolase family protein [Candidatus Rhodoblastus alkanivorans]MDI4640093.1 choloylglycine hydrolase family protein [Rhodoblastus acidophilus]